MLQHAGEVRTPEGHMVDNAGTQGLC
jgi:hypothetical protein